VKFVLSILFYVSAAVVLGIGMLLTFKGNYWVLIGGAVAYTVLLGMIGCRLPEQSHH